VSESLVHVQLLQRQDYQFDIQFGAGIPAVMGDEPAPLGAGLGPSPVQLLAAAVELSVGLAAVFFAQVQTSA
jgi:uncharacterized OsmC-like protein